MKLLIAVPEDPSVFTAGINYKVWNLWRTVASLGSHEIDMVTNGAEARDYLAPTDKGRVRIHVVKKGRKINSVLAALWNPANAFFYKLNNRRLRKKLNSLCKLNKYDVIVADHTWMSPSVLKMSKKYNFPLRILTTHNIEWRKQRARSKKSPWYSAPAWYVLSLFLKRWERRMVSQFDIVTTVAAEDAEHIKELAPNVRTGFISNGVDCNIFKPAKDFKTNSAFFVGTYTYAPNVDGVNYFLTEIYPLLKKSYPKVKCFFAGKNPPKNLVKKFENDENVVFLGYVKDLAKEMSKSAVCIAPIRYGGGTNGKIIEYWAAGKPVVATVKAVSGLEAVDGKNALIRDSPEEFAKALGELVGNRKKVVEMGKHARKTALDNYDWSTIAKEFLKLVKK